MGYVTRWLKHNMITIARSWFNSHSRRVVASLDKTLYDNTLCLVTSNKYIKLIRKKSKNQLENLKVGNS